MKRRSRKPGLDLSDAQGMAAHIARYLEWLHVHNYSEETIRVQCDALARLAEYLSERGVTRPSEVTKPMIERYQRHLYHYRSEKNQRLTFFTQHGYLIPVKGFFRHLAKQNVLLYNPASDIELPKREKRLPRILSAAEVELVLDQINLEHPSGVRDRAMLETLYSTAIRRKELLRLKLTDLDLNRGIVMIRAGKGRKDRVVPIGERAVCWIEKYLAELRPQLATRTDDGTLFLTRWGAAFSLAHFTARVGRYIRKAMPGRRGACHLLRHSTATLMLEGGADIRFIQAMLGHESLASTQIYTQVSIQKLKEIHTATHPGANLRRQKSTLDVDDGEDDELPSLAADNASDQHDVGDADDRPQSRPNPTPSKPRRRRPRS